MVTDAEQPTWWYVEKRYLGRPGWLALFILGALWTWSTVDMARSGWSGHVGAAYVGLVAFTVFVIGFHFSPAGTGGKHVRVGPAGLKVGRWMVPAEAVRTVRVLEYRYAIPAWRSHRFGPYRVRNTNYSKVSFGSAILVEWAGGRRPLLMFTTRDQAQVLELLDLLPNSRLVDLRAPLETV